jgi:hypothetical protein
MSAEGFQAPALLRRLDRAADFLRAWGIEILALFTITPFIVLGFFNHPAADDFMIARGSVERGFLATQALYYREWTGRFFSTAIGTVNPLVFRWMGGFKLVPIAAIAFLFAGAYFLVNEVTRPDWTLGQKVQAALGLLVLYLYGMPDTAQGLYWYSSVMVYQVANALCLFLAGVAVRRFRAGPGSTGGWMNAAAAAATVAAVGSNEPSMIVVFALLGGLLIGVFLRRRVVDRWAVVLLILALAAGAVSVAAPGNANRIAFEARLHHHEPLLSAGAQSFVLAGRELFAWTASAPLLLMTVFFLPRVSALAMRSRQNATSAAFHPAVLAVFFFLLVAALNFPTFWSLGHSPENRTLNVPYLLFLVAFFAAVMHAARLGSRAVLPPLPSYGVLFLSAAVAVSINSGGNNVRRAYEDLLSGRAAAFDRELTNRYARLARCPTPVCDVDEVTNRPPTIFYKDLSNEDSENDAYAFYFGKRTIHMNVMPQPEPADGATRTK